MALLQPACVFVLLILLVIRVLHQISTILLPFASEECPVDPYSTHA